LSGCGQSHGEAGVFNRLDVNAFAIRNQLVVAKLRVRLSATVAKALDRGIPLGLILEADFGVDRAGFWQAPIVLNYHALTRQYQLILPTGAGVTRTFPSRRALLAALRRSVRFELPGDLVAGKPLRARLRLDRAALPAPLRLPAYVMPSWQTVTPWLNLAPRAAIRSSAFSPEESGVWEGFAPLPNTRPFETPAFRPGYGRYCALNGGVSNQHGKA